MAVGKNKKLGKKKKGGKKIVDPFTKKEWFDIKAPTYFQIRQVGKTPANKTVGQKTSKENLLGRLVTANLGDLQAKGDDFRQFTLKIDEVQGTQCLTNFKGMSITTDKLRSLVRKNQSLIESYADVKTTDGYLLRVFVIAFTKRRPNQHRATSYAQTGQIRQIRKKMTSSIIKAVSTGDISQVILKLTTEVIGRAIEKQTAAIYPLQNCIVRKVKVLRAPKADISRLLELHGGAEAVKAFDLAAQAAGIAVERAADDVAATEGETAAPVAEETA